MTRSANTRTRTKISKTDKKRNVKRRTKESGRALGSPEFETARAAKKHIKPRKDSVAGMLRIYDGGWEYDEEIARRENSADKGYYIHSATKALIDPDDAYEIFCQHNYAQQRNLDEQHSRRLASSVRVAPGIDIAIGPDGKAKIVNGQHTLWAIFQRGLTTQASVTIYMCRDEQAMADLYAIFDDNKKRSLNNAIHAAKGANALTYEGKDARLARWSMVVAVAESDFSRKYVNRESQSGKVERAKREDVQDFAKWMDDLVVDALQSKLVPQGIGAAFFAMWTSDPIQAAKFAEGYFSGANLESDSPALVMRNKMSNRPRGEHASSVVRDHAELVFTAWRKFCLDEPLQSLRRTVALPPPTEWKIYKSASKTMRVTLGGRDNAVKVAS